MHDWRCAAGSPPLLRTSEVRVEPELGTARGLSALRGCEPQREARGLVTKRARGGALSAPEDAKADQRDALADDALRVHVLPGLETQMHRGCNAETAFSEQTTTPSNTCPTADAQKPATAGMFDPSRPPKNPCSDGKSGEDPLPAQTSGNRFTHLVRGGCGERS